MNGELLNQRVFQPEGYKNSSKTIQHAHSKYTGNAGHTAAVQATDYRKSSGQILKALKSLHLAR